MCSQKILRLFLFAFFLSLPFIFTSLAASISYFLTDGIKFYVVLPTKIVAFVF